MSAWTSTAVRRSNSSPRSAASPPSLASIQNVTPHTDLEGKPVQIQVDGWRARILQHEFDHLEGVLYVDRLDDGDWKTVQKIARKRGWGRPGAAWTPGVDELEA